VGGATLVADPGRRHAPAFFDAAVRAGYGIATTTTREIPRGGIYRLSR
jgi:hypothetical protein